MDLSEEIQRRQARIASLYDYIRTAVTLENDEHAIRDAATDIEMHKAWIAGARAALAQIEALQKQLAKTTNGENLVAAYDYTIAQLRSELTAARNMYPELCKLRSELAAAKRDGERLDWLEKCCRINEYDGHDMPYSMVRIFTKPNEYWKCGHVDAVGIIKLRTAIDAARSTGSKP